MILFVFCIQSYGFRTIFCWLTLQAVHKLIYFADSTDDFVRLKDWKKEKCVKDNIDNLRLPTANGNDFTCLDKTHHSHLTLPNKQGKTGIALYVAFKHIYRCKKSKYL